MDEEIHAMSGVAILAGDPVPAQCTDLVKCFVNTKARKHLQIFIIPCLRIMMAFTFRAIC